MVDGGRFNGRAERRGVTIVHSLAGKLRHEDDRWKSRLVNRLALYLSFGAVLLGGVVTVHYE